MRIGRLVTIAVFAIGALLLWLSVSLARHDEAHVADGERATGIVVDLRAHLSSRERRSGRSPTLKPVVRFSPRESAGSARSSRAASASSSAWSVRGCSTATRSGTGSQRTACP